MRDERHSEVPVLIAGAGPAGLTAAVALARQGIESLLVERRPDLSALPRATSVSTRSMELVRSWGLEDEIRAGETEAEWLLWICETLATASAGSGVAVGYPTRAQSAVISPTSPACLPQDHLEPVLMRHLSSLGVGRARFGTAVMGLEDRPDGVRAVLRDVESGESRVVDARYLVAADGAHSTVRNALGIPMHGPDRLDEAMTVLFRAPLWSVLGEHRYGIYHTTHAEGGGTFLPAGLGDRWLYSPDTEPAVDFGEQEIVRRIRLGAGVATLQPRIERTGRFSFAAQMAERFRHGNTFIVGDAAHRVTPRGGTGMNIAIHDGYDIGWKLAWVLSGWAGHELLESYEAERRPAVEHNVARSADPNGTRRAAEEELHVDLGGRVAHAWLPSSHGRVSTRDLLGPGLTLYTGPDPAAWQAAAAALPGPLPLAVRSLDAVSARAMGIRADGALLARPDAAPAGWFANSAGAAAALSAAVGGALGAAQPVAPVLSRAA